MTIIHGVHHTGLTVKDMERSLRFYRDYLGLTVTAQWIGSGAHLSAITGFEDVQLKIAWLKTGNDPEHILELVEYASHPGAPQELGTNRPGNGHVCFVVHDIQNAYERLRGQGVRFRSEPTAIPHGINKGAYAVYLEDPDGITVELFQPRQESA